MEKLKNSTHDILHHGPRELVLTEDGHIFTDADCETEVERFCAFYQGNLCARDQDDWYCHGKLPPCSIMLPTAVGKTRVSPIVDEGYLMQSSQRVLDPGAAVIVIFRCREVVGLYVADTSISEAIHFTLVKASLANANFVTTVFSCLLERHDPVLSDKLVQWADIHPLRSREE